MKCCGSVRRRDDAADQESMLTERKADAGELDGESPLTWAAGDMLALLRYDESLWARVRRWCLAETRLMGPTSSIQRGQCLSVIGIPSYMAVVVVVGVT